MSKVTPTKSPQFMSGRSVAMVLVGKETAGRKWINYEIGKAWNDVE
jgi:hypothetical protein